MENKVLNLIYTVFLGLIIAFFIGFGINTFYEPPTQPETAPYTVEDKAPTAEQQQAQNQAWEEYQDKEQHYSRNVSMVALASAVILLVASFALEKRTHVIANGIMLGGLFTLLYSIIRGMISTDSKYTFIAITIGLAVVLYLGYRRFAHPGALAQTRKK